tara:strand:+ start:1389 stop:2438 length:1050 start_codon:yes stop_codon:yes gene_type:complete
MPRSYTVDELRATFNVAVEEAASAEALQSLRDQYLGRKRGAVQALLKSVANAPITERRILGKDANQLKQEIEQALDARRKSLEESHDPTGAIDVTLAGRPVRLGHRHPLTIIREEIEQIFVGLGFEILHGPEVEDDYHNFEALNMPPEHPARDMQDTLYLKQPLQTSDGSTGTLLRTHTSGMQVRYMETHEPPVRIIAPGLVYRRDTPDQTHSPMFQQIEGLLVGDNVTIADLKGTLECFLRQLFEPDTQVMFRPSFFPYTEPSAEVFISCVFCSGSGCSVCKKTGWLEILGSGMVHPAVFEAVGYDPERYTGWAFGIGIDRIAILKYRVEDIRAFYDNDLRLLEQFSY